MIIYKTTNTLNGKFYIGQDSNDDPSYLGSGILLKKAMLKYGKEHFLKETIERCDTKTQLNEREAYWIEKTNAIELGYNLAVGGRGGKTYTEEIRQRISERFRGKKISDETLAKRRETREKRLRENPDAYKHSPETKQKIGEKSKGRIPSEYNRMMSRVKNSGKNNPNYGKSVPWTEERKQAARGKRLSEEHRRKISEGNKGKKMSDEFRQKQRERMTGSKNPMFGKTYSHTDEYKEMLKGEGNPFFGRKHSEETKMKMRSSRQNKTPEQKLERYVRFYISRMGVEPTEEMKMLKYQEYLKC